MILLVGVLGITESSAEEFPQHETTVVHEDEELRCYDLTAAKVFLGYKVEKDKLNKEVSLLKDKSFFLKDQVMALTNMVESKEEIIMLLSERNRNLFKEWKQENKARHDAENSTDLLPWAIAVTSSVLATGLGLYVLVK